MTHWSGALTIAFKNNQVFDVLESLEIITMYIKSSGMSQF